MINEIRSLAIEQFAMSLEGVHGTKHWERVHDNAVYLAGFSGADLTVVRLFAYLHDCCRLSDGRDEEHGLRAARFAESLRSGQLQLSDERFDLLFKACEDHEKGMTSTCPTVGTCWDADRLDLGRCWIRPKPKYLSTERAKHSSVIDIAYKRSRGRKVKFI